MEGITYKERGKQLANFSNLQFGSIYPTDLDGFIDFHNKLFIFFELKVEGVELKTGQRLALERLVDSINPGIHSYGFIATHNTPIEEEINTALCKVIEMRRRKEWIPMQKQTLREVIDKLVKLYG